MFPISLLAVVVAVLSMCSVYLVIEEYHYLLDMKEYSADLSTGREKWNVVACSHSQSEAIIPSWNPFVSKADADILPTPKQSTTRSFLYTIIVISSFGLILTAILPYATCSFNTLSIFEVLHSLQAYFMDENRVAEKFDGTLKDDLKGVYRDLCLFLKKEQSECQSNDPFVLISSIRKAVNEVIGEMERQNDQKISDMKSAQKMFESEVQKDFKFMLAVKDSTIFALRMSVKENNKEIERLKNTIKLQHQSFQQSAEVVKALKNGLLLQHKSKEQLGMQYYTCSPPDLAASIKSLETYSSQYNGSRRNSIYWSYPEELINLCFVAKRQSRSCLPEIGVPHPEESLDCLKSRCHF